MFLSMKYTSFIISLALVLFLGIFPQGTAQAALGDDCVATPAACGTFPCVRVGAVGRCSGPCDKDTPVGTCQSSVGSPLGWKASSCTAANDPTNLTKGTCAELPEKQLPKGPESGNALITTVDIMTNWVFAIFTVLAVIMVLLAAFQFVTGGGDAKKVEEARQKLIWASVGIIIALLAKGIVPVLRAILGV